MMNVSEVRKLSGSDKVAIGSLYRPQRDPNLCSVVVNQFISHAINYLFGDRNRYGGYTTQDVLFQKNNSTATGLATVWANTSQDFTYIVDSHVRNIFGVVFH